MQRSVSSTSSRVQMVLELCKAMFEKYDHNHDGCIDLSLIESSLSSSSNGFISPRGGVIVVFDEFLRYMIQYDGETDSCDETSISMYLESMPIHRFQEIIDNLHEDAMSSMETIQASLRKIIRKQDMLESPAFLGTISALAPSTQMDIIQSLNLILTGLEKAEDTLSLIGRSRYQELLDAARRAFDLFDTDGDGTIVWDEFRTVFGQHFESCHSKMPATELDLYAAKFASLQMDQFDENSDGKVTFAEFFGYLCLEGYEDDRNNQDAIAKFFGSLSQESIDEILGIIQFYESACVEMTV